MNMEQIGYFLYMEEQEKKATEESQKTEEISDAMNQLASLVQENYRDLLYPHHD